MATEPDGSAKRNSAATSPSPGRPEEEPESGSRGGPSGSATGLGRRVLRGSASAVAGFSVLVAIMMALEITFKVFQANGDNAIVQFVDGWTQWLAWEFRDLFTPEDKRVEVLVNFGLAGVAYLVAGRLVSGLIRRVS